MKLILCILASALAGCSLQLEDKRLTREEVATAFKQRDASLEALAKELVRVRDAAKIPAPEAKK